MFEDRYFQDEAVLRKYGISFDEISTPSVKDTIRFKQGNTIYVLFKRVGIVRGTD